MKVYRFKEHTADIKVYSKGKDCGEAIESLLNALCEIVEGKGEEDIEKEFSYKGKYEEEFIVGIIEDFLFKIEKHHIVPKRVKLKKIEYNKFYVIYKIYGKRGNPENIIKSPTFHGLKIEKEEGCKIEVVLDV